jgi:hypothetical protein
MGMERGRPMIKRIILIAFLFILLPSFVLAQGPIVFGATDPPINLLTNSGFGWWSNSELAQNTTGRQTDFEWGTAIRNDDPDDADKSGEYTVADCTIVRTNVPGGGAGGDNYFYTIARNNPGAATQTVYVALAGLVIGHDYKFSCYIKNGTDAYSTACQIQALNNARTVTLNFTVLATEAAWADYSVIWRATETNNTIRFYLDIDAADETMLVDEIYVIEVTPGNVAADNLACDYWYKDTTLDVLRTPNGTYTQNGSYHGLTCKPSAADDFIYYPNATVRSSPYWYERFAGKQVVGGAWVWTATASHVFIQLIQSTTTDYSQASNASVYHTGGSVWEWLEVTSFVATNSTEFSMAFVFDQAAGVTYICQPVLTYGDRIGPGNYGPLPGETIYFEKAVASHQFHAGSGYSDTADTTIYLGGSSNAVVPYTAKAVRIYVGVNDSGSAGTNCYLYIGADISVNNEFIVSPYGRANDTVMRDVGWTSLTAGGNFKYAIEASGGSTFDTPTWYYIGGQTR